MGGRTNRGGSSDRDDYSDREKWIKEVSTSRLETYARMLTSPSARPVRSDGTGRIAGGDYFRDLVSREKSRRGL